MAKGGKKDAKYIVGLLKPIISRIEKTKDPHNQKSDHRGVVDLLLFDGASNVQNAPGKVGTQKCRGVVGLPMMVLALVIGKGGSNNDEGCSNKINDNDNGRFDICLVH
jgi:hypothetical protein